MDSVEADVCPDVGGGSGNAVLPVRARCLLVGSTGTFLMSFSKAGSYIFLVSLCTNENATRRKKVRTQDGGDMVLGLQQAHTACASRENPRTRSAWQYQQIFENQCNNKAK